MSYYQPQRITDQRGSVWHVLIAWAFAVFTLFYFLPWAIAASRHKSNTLAIALVNFLLGWTFIGWVVALVMACGSHQMAVVPQQGYYPAPGYPPPGYLPPPPSQGYLPPAPIQLDVPQQVTYPQLDAGTSQQDTTEIPRA